jgi:molybdopterin/thiamine biosynthesis adenylyltransferase
LDIKTIHLIGAGSLGSFTAQILAKMNRTLRCDINVWDFDKVEEHNLNNQLYSQRDIGKLKVVALSEIIKNIGDSEIKTVNLEFDEKKDLRGILIVAVDTMRARKKILNMARFNWGIDYLIEARMGGSIAKIFALDPRHPEAVKLYEQYFYEDIEAENPICATNETIPSLWIVAASIAHLVLLHRNSLFLKHKFASITVNLDKYPIVNSDGCALI